MKLSITGVFMSFVLSVQVWAVDVQHTFSAGSPARASEVNENFQALSDAIDSAGSASFSDYFISSSADGTLNNRNVIVTTSGSGCYTARIWFTNTTGVQVNNATTTVTPDEVFVLQFICGDTSNVSYELEYIYALPATGVAPWFGFEQAEGVEINEDANGDGAYDTNFASDYRFSVVQNPLGTMNLMQGNEYFIDSSGELVAATDFSVVLTPMGSPLVEFY